MLAKNGYPGSYIDNCIKDLLNKKHNYGNQNNGKENKNPIKYVIFKIPYLGPVSTQVLTEINHFFDKIDNDRIKARMVHDTCKLSKIFKVKESQALLHQSKIVYF